MQDLEDRLKELGDRVSREAPSELRPTPRALRRVRVGRAIRSGAVLATVAALVVGGFAGARSLSGDEAAPVPPAEQGDREIEPMRNGRILHGENASRWLEEAPDYAWSAFDQDTNSFLFITERILGIGEDGVIADFDCPSSAGCGAFGSFGPGLEEVTVPVVKNQSCCELQVIGFDGTVRDTLDISDVVNQGQHLSRGVAWSPDGSRLAISTGPEDGCIASCEGKVWILDRDLSDAQLVFTERGSKQPVLSNLAWSPDGASLALISGEDDADPDIRLVVLRLRPGQPAREKTLHVYDVDDWREEEGNEALLSALYNLHFAFAWSPDGTLIAVTSMGGVTEISAEDGEVVARPSPDRYPRPVHGPLAWLREI